MPEHGGQNAGHTIGDGSSDRVPLPAHSFDPSQRSHRSPCELAQAQANAALAPFEGRGSGVADCQPVSRSQATVAGVIGSVARITLAQHAIERPQPFAAVGLLRQPFRPQQVTQLRMGADDAERDMTRRQFIMKIEQHPGSGQIDSGRCRKIAGYHLDVRRFLQRPQNRLQNRLGIDVEHEASGRNAMTPTSGSTPSCLALSE